MRASSIAQAVVVFALMACSAAAVGASTVSAGQRYPIIACDDPRYPYANHYGWSYAPTGYCGARRGSGAEGIDQTHWRAWGQKQAFGRGFLVVYVGAVEEFPATITASDFSATHNFVGTNEYVSAYAHLKIHITSRMAKGGTWRGPLDLTLNVQIQE